MTEPATKRCSVCGLIKPVGEFQWHRREKQQRDSYCRPCRAEYKKRHYAANRDRYLQKTAERKRRLARENAHRLIAYLSKRPCVDCGETDPLVLEFDHVSTKTFGIANQLRDRDWPAIAAEIEKCEVVCANCHRRRTARRGGFARALASDREVCARGRRCDKARLVWTALRSVSRE